MPDNLIYFYTAMLCHGILLLSKEDRRPTVLYLQKFRDCLDGIFVSIPAFSATTSPGCSYASEVASTRGPVHRFLEFLPHQERGSNILSGML